MRKNSYFKKRRAKIMVVCYKCARWTCNKCYRSKWLILVIQEDKIPFIKMGKEFLDDIIQALEMHPSRDIHRALLDLVKLFNKEKEHYSLRNLMLKDPIF